MFSFSDGDLRGLRVEANTISFTPGYFPNMSPHIWSWDYSMASHAKAAVFVHEMVHVWQSGHGSHNLLRGAYLHVRYRGNYEKSYNTISIHRPSSAISTWSSRRRSSRIIT